MPLKIFLIEDNEMLRNELREALEEVVPVEVVGSANNERTAVHWLSSHDGGWDVAIVDLQLKQGSGIAALEWCRTRRKDQRVVVLSNYLTEDVRTRCLALGADAAFDKSHDIDKLLDYCRERHDAVRA
ncbi:response regulator [Variovorax sp. VNK109]|jgi:DNA-binding NarL/FixJ family response regulator|uniref:response regulator n=1 Tax=Variovorax sp. VNK109 TaxID=3400919 RepID=UPI003BFE03FA